MSKVIILTDRNNKLKYEQNKKMLFKSRLEMKSSHSKNIVPLSISNITSNKIKKTLKMKDNQKSSNKNEKINAYTHKKNLVYINGNNNIFRDEKNIYPKNFNSTFNNFAKNINKDNIFRNTHSKKETSKNYNSNKTFINKSLNNSIIGKSILYNKKIQNNNKKIIKKNKFNEKKKILSLSNSLTKSNRNNINTYNKKNINKNIKKNIFSTNENITNNHINDSIININYPKLQIKDFKISAISGTDNPQIIQEAYKLDIDEFISINTKSLS